MSERRLRQALLDAPVPDARQSEERGLALVRAAYRAEPPPLRPRRRVGVRRGLQVAVAVGLLAAAISPAGAAVRDWVGEAVEPDQKPAQPALTSLPAPGRLLVDSARGPWVVHADGSRRLLGDYRESSWSPHGLYVAVTNRTQLAAVDPLGGVRWTLARTGPVRHPAWSPDGYRIAYLNGPELRVVAGDGSGDRRLEPAVAAVGPAWDPRGARMLSFVTQGGRVRTVQADDGRVAFEASVAAAPTGLEWSPDGGRLLVVSRTGLEAVDRDGGLAWRAPAPRGTRVLAAAIAPGGERAAAVLASRAGNRGALVILGRGSPRTLFEGPGRFDDVTYSPGGDRLLLTWSGADQWLFLDPRGKRRVVAISDIAAQFDPGTTSPPAFPSVAGWCCAANR